MKKPTTDKGRFALSDRHKNPTLNTRGARHSCESGLKKLAMIPRAERDAHIVQAEELLRQAVEILARADIVLSQDYYGFGQTEKTP